MQANRWRGFKIKNQASKTDSFEVRSRVFAAAFGAFLGLSLLKFGNPPIMEKWVAAPTNAYEFVLGYPWPITWAYVLLGLMALLGLSAVQRPGAAPQWILLLPVAWLTWQIVASARSVQPELSGPTVYHFVACVACFYLGYFCLSRANDLRLFWAAILCALVVVLGLGWEQHFGGLAATQRYFYLYLYPKMKEVPPEYLKKMASTRIFATLFYPNALAGVLLLLLPPMLAVLGQARRLFTAGARQFLVLAVALGGLGCLYWSGSKGGWLLMLLLGFLALLRLPFAKALKISLLTVVLAGGLAGFFWKYAGFFQRGATSVSARFDYWHAALQTAGSHPLYGTGPGTFAKPYQQLKRPESEMARLAHNDYLEQASDSGLAGFVSYAAFIIAALILAYPRPWALPGPIGIGLVRASPSAGSPPDWLPGCIWLGVLGWALQSLFEFGLYIPALAWPAFAFMGLLLGWRKGQP